jgi:hypothetical protein
LFQSVKAITFFHAATSRRLTGPELNSVTSSQPSVVMRSFSPAFAGSDQHRSDGPGDAIIVERKPTVRSLHQSPSTC